MNRNQIISYLDMCTREGLSLQRGMNYFGPPKYSIVLSSHRPGAPYEDRLEEDGTVLIYEGHDEPRSASTPQPKLMDQPLTTSHGKSTQNGLFYAAAQAYVRGEAEPIEVRVYEKIKNGIWSYNGRFVLIDSWTETSHRRRVCKFKLGALEDAQDPSDSALPLPREEQTRIIPSNIKLAVWRRDKGACVLCGATSNLHFDHILPYSKGGTSQIEENIQLLCLKHNLSKGARIQ